jgi:antitoxin component HigA of HigAB toxin-antitoxin module
MTKLRTEAEYQTAMQRLEYLVDHEPEKLDEITALGNVVNAYENDNGHRPLHPDSLIARIEREMESIKKCGAMGLSGHR